MSWRKSGFRTTIIIILIVAICYITNPTMNDFGRYISDQIAIEHEDNNIMKGIKNLLTTKVVDTFCHRNNYYLFSTYKSEIVSEETLYIGIFKNFIRIH